MNSTSSDFIIIGSGVAGLSTALRLRLKGKSVRVFERKGLASGSSSRASGLIGQMRSTPAATRMIMESVELLREIEDRAGMKIFRQTGSVRVAQTEARTAELKEHLDVARQAGLEAWEVDQTDLREWMPYLHSEDVLLAAFCPTDGYLNPPELAEAYLKCCRDCGVEFHPDTPVEKILVENKEATGVRADGENYSSPMVVNAAGPWSFMVAQSAKSHLATTAISHYYFTTRDSEVCIDLESATLRDRENRIYSRPYGEGLRVGIYETHPEGFDIEGAGPGFTMRDMTASKDHPTIRALIEASKKRFKNIDNDTEMEITGGVMSFTPDGHSLLGEIPGVKGLYHCSGFCGHGVTQSPAIGAAMAEFLLEGTFRYDLEEVRADRFHDFPDLQTREGVEKAGIKAYAEYYGPGPSR